MYVCLCVYICTLRAQRKDMPICYIASMLISSNHEEISERTKLRKSVLGSSSAEGGFRSSETKHDRRTAPRPKLFATAKRLQE
jgi:hypothetical protein